MHTAQSFRPLPIGSHYGNFLKNHTHLSRQQTTRHHYRDAKNRVSFWMLLVSVISLAFLVGYGFGFSACAKFLA